MKKGKVHKTIEPSLSLFLALLEGVGAMSLALRTAEERFLVSCRCWGFFFSSVLFFLDKPLMDVL